MKRLKSLSNFTKVWISFLIGFGGFLFLTFLFGLVTEEINTIKTDGLKEDVLSVTKAMLSILTILLPIITTEKLIEKTTGLNVKIWDILVTIFIAWLIGLGLVVAVKIIGSFIGIDPGFSLPGDAESIIMLIVGSVFASRWLTQSLEREAARQDKN